MTNTTLLMAVGLAALCAQCASGTVPMAAFAPVNAAVSDKSALLAAAPELDAFFQHKFDSRKPTAFAVGIMLDGELVYARTFGVIDATSQRPIDADTLFRIASMTKSFTALAVLKLRDEGALALDVPLTRYLPELAQLAPLTRDAPPLTARMLRRAPQEAAGVVEEFKRLPETLKGASTFDAMKDALSSAVLTFAEPTDNEPH